MRHGKSIKQLGRVARQRKALLRTLTVALVKNGRIKTTLAKARVLRPYVEKIVTKAKIEGMMTIRALRKDFNEKTAKALIENWAPSFMDRKGGYTRIIKVNPRKSDASPMAFIEFVEKQAEKKSKVEGRKSKAKVSKKPARPAGGEKPAKK